MPSLTVVVDVQAIVPFSTTNTFDPLTNALSEQVSDYGAFVVTRTILRDEEGKLLGESWTVEDAP